MRAPILLVCRAYVVHVFIQFVVIVLRIDVHLAHTTVATSSSHHNLRTAANGTLKWCQEQADAFCNTPASGNGTAACTAFQPAHCQSEYAYVARLGRGSPERNQLALKWRCYAPQVAANASNTNFARDVTAPSTKNSSLSVNSG